MPHSLKKILLIDDDEVNNFVVKQFIKRLGVDRYIVTETNNGSQALAYLQSCKEESKFPSYILVDLSMPVMDGEEFLQNYQKHFYGLNKDARVAVITASIRDSDKSLVDKYDFIYGFISKPIGEEFLKKFFELS